MENETPENKLVADSQFEIHTVDEVASFLKKSSSWVYKNWKLIGGKKIGGSLFFPSVEKIYEHIFCEGERVALRLSDEKETLHRTMVQNQKTCNSSRSKKKRRTEVPKSNSEQRTDDDRHNLFDTGKRKA